MCIDVDSGFGKLFGGVENGIIEVSRYLGMVDYLKRYGVDECWLLVHRNVRHKEKKA